MSVVFKPTPVKQVNCDTTGPYKRRWGLLHRSAVTALTLSIILTSSFALAEQKIKSSPLRGTAYGWEGSDTSAMNELRGSDLNGIQTRDSLDYHEDDRLSTEPNLFQDAKDTTQYIFKHNVISLLRKGPADADEQRTLSPIIPSRATLRDSMIQNITVYEDFRGSNSSVGQTVASALRGSYTARAVLQRAEADRARMHGTLANFLPRVNGTLTAETGPLNTFGGSSKPVGRTSGTIDVSLPLFTSGVNLNTYKEAAYLSRAADNTFLAEEHRVALEAITAHVNLSLNRTIERLLAKNARAMKNIVVAATSLFDAGEASRTDVAVAEANYENARAELENAKLLRKEFQSDYESLTGRKAPKRLSLPNYRGVIPNTVEAAVQIAMRNNPTLLASHDTAQANKHAAKAAFGRYGPQLNLTGQYEHEFSRSTDPADTDNWNVGVRLTVPLLDATLAPTVQAARATAIEARFRALDQGRDIERLVRRQWAAYRSNNRRVGIIQRQAKADARRVDGSRKEFEAGLRPLGDVINDQIRHARTQITLERARHERVLSAYQLAITTAHPRIQRLAAGH